MTKKKKEKMEKEIENEWESEWFKENDRKRVIEREKERKRMHESKKKLSGYWRILLNGKSWVRISTVEISQQAILIWKQILGRNERCAVIL